MKRSKTGALIGVVILLLALLPAALSEGTALEDHEEHAWETVSETAATCGESAFSYVRCSVCGEEKAVRGEAASGAHLLENGRCTVCGYLDVTGMTEEEAVEAYGFYVYDRDLSGSWNTGDEVLFGSYPQSRVEDAALLESLAGYETGDAGWISYGYYDAGLVSDYMTYLDVTLEGRRFRGVRLTAYRPYYSGLPAEDQYSYIDEEGFEIGKVYWFAWEPIRWNVLEYRDGALLLSARTCLDAQPFQDLYEGNRSKMVIPGTDTLVNDWEASSVRTYLNSTFLETALTEDEAARLVETELNNRTTGYAVNSKFQIIQRDTRDRVFLLSYEDMLNTDYGFPEKASYDLETNGDKINSVPEALLRRRSYTAYATIQGCRSSQQGATVDGEHACYYMLRSAGSVKFSICGVSKYGSASYSGSINPTSKSSQDGLAFNGDFGLLPALRIQAGP